MSQIAAARRVVRLLRSPEAALGLGGADWNEVLPQLRKSRMLGRFAMRAEQEDVAARLPDRVREHMRAALVLAQSNRETLLWESREVERALAPIGVPVVLLKGASFIVADLPAGRGRPSNDLDVLVPRDSLDRVTEALRGAGWEGSQMAAGEKEHFLRWMHQLPTMYHGIRSTAIDIHHAISPIAGLNNVDPASLFQSSVAIEGRHLRVLAPEDMVILAAVHWARSSGTPGSIRDFLDIDDLVRDFSATDPGFHDRLAARGAFLGVADTLDTALSLAQSFFGTPGPPRPVSAPLEALVLLGGVSTGSHAPNRLQRAARQILTWRSYRMQMPVSLMISRAVNSRLERFGLKRQPAA